MKQLLVTTPLLPPLQEFVEVLEGIWDRKWLTNNGSCHQLLESKLKEHLNVEHLCLVANGTLALELAIRSLNLKGEIVTTPYSFAATSTAIVTAGCQPRFVDVRKEDLNIDPEQVEAAVTSDTVAILAVHVYGNPCNHEALVRIANKYDLRLIYDAAHAFGVKKDGHSILSWGDASTISFHATKAFSTVEGGAIVAAGNSVIDHVTKLKNFGFSGELTLDSPGTNAKLNELQAAFGLLALKHINGAIARRKQVSQRYRELLNDLDGIRFLVSEANVELNYSYMPILINREEFGHSRDTVFEMMKANGVIARRYFFPLLSDFTAFSQWAPCRKSITVANTAAQEVLCLPLHHEMDDGDVDRVVGLLKRIKKHE